MMPLTVTPPLLMAAIAFYIALSYFLMYCRQKREVEHLWFSFMCFSIALYDVFASLLYGTDSPELAVRYQRFQFITPAMFIIAITWFIAALTHIDDCIAYGISSCMIVFIIAGFMLPNNSFTLTVDKFSVKRFSLLGFQISYSEADPGIFYAVQYFAMIATGIYLLYKAYFWSRGGDIHLKTLFLSLSIFLLTSINDVMVGKGIYRFLYLVEYGYFFVILSMAFMLQYRFITLHNEIEKLSFLMNQQIMENQNTHATVTNSRQKFLSASNSEKIQ